MNEEMRKYFRPMPKMSQAVKGRKTIKYLQQCKEEGKKIVQHCPALLGPFFMMAAGMADVDIARIAPTDLYINQEQALQNSAAQLTTYRNMNPYIHINYTTDTIAFYSKEEALKNFSNFHMAGADSILPMAINNETLKYVSDNAVIIYGHVGALSGWQTNGTHGGYKKFCKTAEEAVNFFKKAYEYQENGMKAMSVELVPGEVTAKLAEKIKVPVIGIACGCTGGKIDADGYEMVDMDLFDMMQKPAQHAKSFGSFLEFATGVYGAWVNEVRTNQYPTEANGWHMDEAELEKFNEAVEKF